MVLREIPYIYSIVQIYKFAQKNKKINKKFQCPTKILCTIIILRKALKGIFYERTNKKISHFNVGKVNSCR